MALNKKNIIRWYKMLIGKSVWHVNQDIGKCFSVDSIKGYYNDMTEKVTKLPFLLESEGLPLLETADGKKVEMPVAIFQYGLGAYDLYLQTSEDVYKKKFLQCVDWAINHIDEQGRWNNFFYVYPDHPYGAMAQGEGISLLIRAYEYTHNYKYIEIAEKAIDYMLLPIDKGGTTIYKNGEVIFVEYTHRPIVMNGWIFAWWGVYDYVAATRDEGKYKEALDDSCATLLNYLTQFKRWHWSKYDVSGRIASPFYHNLHIAQMQAMYELTGENIFKQYATLWAKQQKNPLCKSLAFIKKTIEKIVE